MPLISMTLAGFKITMDARYDFTARQCRNYITDFPPCEADFFVSTTDAYRLLEEEKLIESLQGSKSTMVLTAEKIAVIREELLEADAKGAVQKLKQMGISKAEAIALIEKYWEDGTVAESGE